MTERDENDQAQRGRSGARFTEGVKFIHPENKEDWIDLSAVPPNWIGWHQAEVTEDYVRVPAVNISGQHVVIDLPKSYILGYCEAPSVQEFLAKKVKDYPPSEDNTYWWANPKD